MNHHCRVGRVRMKGGGADVRVLRNQYPASTMSIRKGASLLLNNANGFPDAWCVVGFWSKTGDWCCNMEVYEESNLHPRYFPDAVRQLLELRINQRNIPISPSAPSAG